MDYRTEVADLTGFLQAANSLVRSQIPLFFSQKWKRLNATSEPIFFSWIKSEKSQKPKNDINCINIVGIQPVPFTFQISALENLVSTCAPNVNKTASLSRNLLTPRMGHSLDSAFRFWQNEPWKEEIDRRWIHGSLKPFPRNPNKVHSVLSAHGNLCVWHMHF